jgi:hypothetical protein
MDRSRVARQVMAYRPKGKDPLEDPYTLERGRNRPLRPNTCQGEWETD